MDSTLQKTVGILCWSINYHWSINILYGFIGNVKKLGTYENDFRGITLIKSTKNKLMVLMTLDVLQRHQRKYFCVF
jgi:hypothetical protein